VQKYSSALEQKGLVYRKEKFAILPENARHFITRNNFVHKSVDSHVPKPTLLKYNNIIFRDKFFLKKKEAIEALKKRARRAKEFRKLHNITFMQDETIRLETYLNDDTLLERVQKRVKYDKDETFDLNYIRSVAKKGTVPAKAEVSFYEQKLYGLLMNDLKPGAKTYGWDVDYVWEKTYHRSG
jgi:hypothetical protein